jgi:hypothetical protein
MANPIFKIILLFLLFSLSEGLYAQVSIREGRLKSRTPMNDISKNTSDENDEVTTEESYTSGNKSAVEIIFTKEYYDNFDLAKPHAIHEVMDGDPLWLYAKLEQPLKNYVYTQRVTANDGSVKTLRHFQLGIGPQGEESDYENIQIWVGNEHGESISGTCNIIPADYLEKKEFLLSLTTFKKYLSTKLFIELVGSGDAGIWENEIRFYKGIIEAGADNPALGVGKITCNLENGVVKYRKMWNTFNEVLEKGSAEDNSLPNKGHFEDAALKNTIINDLKNHGLTFNKVYFVTGWIDYNANTGERYRKAQAVYTYKKEGRCFFGFVYPTQYLNNLTGSWTPIKLEYEGNGFPITCDKY